MIWFVIILFIFCIFCSCLKVVIWIVLSVLKWLVKFNVVDLFILWIFNVKRKWGKVVCFVFFKLFRIFWVDFLFICFNCIKIVLLSLNRFVGVLINLFVINCLINFLFMFLIFIVLWEMKCFNVFLCWVL